MQNRALEVNTAFSRILTYLYIICCFYSRFKSTQSIT